MRAGVVVQGHGVEAVAMAIGECEGGAGRSELAALATACRMPGAWSLDAQGQSPAEVRGKEYSRPHQVCVREAPFPASPALVFSLFSLVFPLEENLKTAFLSY